MPALSNKNIQPRADRAKTLVDVLVAEGAISSGYAKKIRLTEVQSGKSQEEIIRSLSVVDDKALVKAKSVLYNIPYIDLENIPASPEALATLPKEVAKRFAIFPISIDKASGQITVAMADPLNFTAIEFIEQKTGLRVIPNAAEPSIIDEFISTRYVTTLAREVTEALKEVSGERGIVGKIETENRLITS